jgi:hypothetical protein
MFVDIGPPVRVGADLGLQSIDIPELVVDEEPARRELAIA